MNSLESVMDGIAVANVSEDDPNIVFVSASQIGTFRSCPRKWAFDKIGGVERGETAATNEGHAIHKEVEDYFNTNKSPNRAEAKALLPHLPRRHIDVKAEVVFQFSWPGVDGVIARGFIDLVDFLEDCVFDHKTVADINRSAKTAEQLQYDPQSIIYGAAFRTIKPVDDVKLQWTYVKREQPKTRLPKTQPVNHVQDLTTLAEGLKQLTPTVIQIRDLRRKVGLKVLDVEPNRSACFEYGPCQMRDLCPDYAGRTKEPKPKAEPMSPELRAKLAAASASAPNVPVPTEIPAESRLPTDEITSEPEIKQAHKMPLLDTLRISMDAKPAVLPPDATPNVSQTDPPAPPVVPEVEKAKRGRPRKSPAVVEAEARLKPEPEVEAGRSAEEEAELADLAVILIDAHELIRSTIQAAREHGNLDQRIEASKIAVDYLKNLA